MFSKKVSFLTSTSMNYNSLIPSKLKEKFWLVSADMGYGHQRAIHPLKALAKGENILNANLSPKASLKERRLWKNTLRTYEFMSRAGKIPIIGRLISLILDSVLYIPDFYPLKDRSNPTLQVKYLKRKIKKGLCNGILEESKDPKLPIITSFFSPHIAAEMAGYEDVFCIICDIDINRVWAPQNSSQTKIKYFASDSISAKRLISYGVPEKNILITGFPLPLELLGNHSLNTLRSNLGRRLKNLDPNAVFNLLYKHSVSAFLSDENNVYTPSQIQENPLTITFVVGGAGAQKEIAGKITKSLAEMIINGKVILNLVAGTRTEVRDYFSSVKQQFTYNSQNVKIIWAADNHSYFDLFNNCLHTTDILWTKPSELSLYSALGIPIIMCPPIGPQEICNSKWLLEIGAGVKQLDPQYANQWLFDLLINGRLAEAAWNGFLKARKYGTYNILSFLETGTFDITNDPLKR